VVGRLRMGEAGYRYERLRAGDHHDHLICDHCGKVIEFFEARIEALQDEVAERHGFVLLSHSHQMRGICRSCRPRAKTGSSATVSASEGSSDSKSPTRPVPIASRSRE